MASTQSYVKRQGLYDPRLEHDSCGFGLHADLHGRPEHQILQTALAALCRLTHRGAVAADGKTGDGCGLLFTMPDAFMRKVALANKINLPEHYAVGMVFMDPQQQSQARSAMEHGLGEAGLKTLGWRSVPVEISVCGVKAASCCPTVEQVFVELPSGSEESANRAKLYLGRRLAEKRMAADSYFYICSLSSKLLSYKGLVMPEHLLGFYPDLQDTDMATGMCLFHQRFSTNTMPRWSLAQPFRHLAHNGEINTIEGNRLHAAARQSLHRNTIIPQVENVFPLTSSQDSDSCSLDNVLEFMAAGGLDFLHSLRIMIPPAWQNVGYMGSRLRAYYRYHSRKMEAWDGPAGVVATDGRYGACIMDRNGLRPARYVVTSDGKVTIGSEFGLREINPAEITAQGRLRPGEMIAVDTDKGELLLSKELDQVFQSSQPWHEWLREHAIRLEVPLSEQPLCTEPMAKVELKAAKKMFMLTWEEQEQILAVLAARGEEAVGSMGDDTPLPVMSSVQRSLYDSFRQRFAQVTNPPIDSIREQVVMSLNTWIGSEQSLFESLPEHAAGVEIKSPVVSEAKFKALLDLEERNLSHTTLCLQYDPSQQNLEQAINNICDKAVCEVQEGHTIIVLSDRAVSQGKIPVHAALATGAVHHRLINEGLRCSANIIVETATARDPHHFAVLVGYGATAVYPYLSYQVLHSMFCDGVNVGVRSEDIGRTYRRGVNKGLYKIMSKMGISTVASYRGAQLFEIIGLDAAVVQLCFPGAISRIEGMGFDHIQEDQQQLAATAWQLEVPVQTGGLLKFVHGGEFHAYNPDVVTSLQRAVTSGEYKQYKDYSGMVHSRDASMLRDLMELDFDGEPIPLDEVESEEKILVRFDTAGMSLGALSPVAHETLAQAMNALGGRSNSGEGGEDPKRYNSDKNSRIKQIASGRFGVTPHYLVNADVLQIKMAQGAKPGEGGQLPGHKVNKMIATLRHSMPGISLISPPPHHDIYSIEDLAQLIFDLKQVNPTAMVSVKLVATAGVGTIAAGVTKAYADLITIAGHDGGTGASPLTSVKYAGSPWELGLAETHQVLRANDLRNRVRVQVDGGLKTGFDVVKAAIIGAESFGFGTAPMIAMGCKYLRICHLNNCATGVATQNVILYTKHFKPDSVRKVINYFRFVARETREIMASIGVRSFEDMIGRTNFLRIMPGETDRQRKLQLQLVLDPGAAEDSVPHFCTVARNKPFDKGILAEKIMQDVLPALDSGKGGEYSYKICNRDRSIGARLSGEMARRFGSGSPPGGILRLHFTGTAGQSLGVWNAAGLEMVLCGTANDYVGKGMAGGKLTLCFPEDYALARNESVIMGNACLYGATGGRLYAAGCAGDRFAVRNSGAITVVEGVGDHGCEYMTSGVVVVLGETGINFGAGMTGGLAFVYDPERRFGDRYNNDFIDISRIASENHENYSDTLMRLIEQHVSETGSPHADAIYKDFYAAVGDFWLVYPKSAKVSSLMDFLQAAA
ncbi:MAG: glutamate synthase large subunit [Candidatus Porifericomitaceae bacterium WSBS_2022_MAG_OTU9]